MSVQKIDFSARFQSDCVRTIAADRYTDTHTYSHSTHIRLVFSVVEVEHTKYYEHNAHTAVLYVTSQTPCAEMLKLHSETERKYM